jgi:hypothetical protein
MTDTGIDLSVSLETICATCRAIVSNDQLGLHQAWHDSQSITNGLYGTPASQMGIYAGMPPQDVINALASKIQSLQNELRNQIMLVQTCLGAIEQVIGTKDNYRFVEKTPLPEPVHARTDTF